MPRSLVIRSGEPPSEHVVDENSVPTEAALHEVLMRHPALVPASDLGLGRMVTVGFEAGLASGNADLVLLDEAGRLCVVEVKKEGNPDTRRVVAQLLDYASALWGMTLADFERQVLRTRLGAADSRTLAQFVADELLTEGEDDVEAATEQVLEALSDTLRSGDFALVVAAPVIPPGVQRAIEYLNARGLSMYGLEVSYFAGDVEAFVPRVVVRPTVGGQIAGQGHANPSATIDPDTYFASISEGAATMLRAFLEDAVTRGGELQWQRNGFRIRARGGAGPRVIAAFDRTTAYISVGPRKGIPEELRERMTARLRPISHANVGTDWATLRLNDVRPEDLELFLAVGLDYVTELLAGSATQQPSPAT